MFDVIDDLKNYENKFIKWKAIIKRKKDKKYSNKQWIRMSNRNKRSLYRKWNNEAIDKKKLFVWNYINYGSKNKPFFNFPL